MKMCEGRGVHNHDRVASFLSHPVEEAFIRLSPIHRHATRNAALWTVQCRAGVVGVAALLEVEGVHNQDLVV